MNRHLIRRELRLRLAAAAAGAAGLASVACCAVAHLTEVWH